VVEVMVLVGDKGPVTSQCTETCESTRCRWRFYRTMSGRNTQVSCSPASTAGVVGGVVGTGVMVCGPGLVTVGDVVRVAAGTGMLVDFGKSVLVTVGMGMFVGVLVAVGVGVLVGAGNGVLVAAGKGVFVTVVRGPNSALPFVKVAILQPARTAPRTAIRR
jgi:hypothetical protein